MNLDDIAFETVSISRTPAQALVSLYLFMAVRWWELAAAGARAWGWK